MSGGHWDYIQYRFTDISEDIKQLVEKNGKPLTKEELKDGYHNDEWYEKYPEDLNHYKYTDEVIEKFKEAAEIITKAQIYIQRIDYLLSGDNGEDTFLERLEDDLNKLK